MKRADFRHLEPLRVRWVEVDLQKIVFNGHYLMYVDTAVAGYWRALAMPYHETMESLQGDLYVRKATLEYEASARYDERLEVGIRCARIGRSSLVFSAAVFRGEQVLVHGELVYVFADPATQTSRPVPEPLRDLFAAFEAGERMFEVRTGPWSVLGDDAAAVRRAVFVDEHRVPADIAFDDQDRGALHAVAYNRFGLALCAGRIRLAEPSAEAPPAERTARIERLATRPAVRGGGLGRSVVGVLTDAAAAQGAARIVVQAQGTAVSFYRQLGFEPVGDVFESAGLPHQTLQRAIQPG